jgi:hypothetical protein
LRERKAQKRKENVKLQAGNNLKNGIVTQKSGQIPNVTDIEIPHPRPDFQKNGGIGAWIASKRRGWNADVNS